MLQLALDNGGEQLGRSPSCTAHCQRSPPVLIDSALIRRLEMQHDERNIPIGKKDLMLAEHVRARRLDMPEHRLVLQHHILRQRIRIGNP